jgi:hypothetical protein
VGENSEGKKGEILGAGGKDLKFFTTKLRQKFQESKAWKEPCLGVS